MMSDYLSDNLIYEIFTRLPPNSLLRFRSLSKSWYSCISSHCFIRMHYSRSPQKLLIKHQLRGQLRGFYTLRSEDQLPLCPKRGYMDISQVEDPNDIISSYGVGSCNGIFCTFHYKDGLHLWNFSIGRQLVVPDCPLPNRPRGCSPWKLHGFGFDPITDDYKIVCISFPKEFKRPDSSFVYAIKTGTWCAIASPIPLFSLFSDNETAACSVNGALQWVVRLCHTDSDEIKCFYILTFDLSTHVFGTIAMPKPSYTSSELGLTTIQGSLGLVSMDADYINDDDNDNVWIWAKRDASWSIVLKLKTSEVGGSVTGVLQPSNNGDMLLLYECMRSQVYNPKTGARSRLAEFNASSYIDRKEMFVESLYLLDMESACDGNHLSLLGEKK